LADDSKAARAARQFLTTDEELFGAFFGDIGPKPGVEAFSVLAFGATVILTSSRILGLVIAVAVFASVVRRRRHVLVALTSQGLVEIDSGLRRTPRPGDPVSRLRTRPNLLYAEAGDPYVTVYGRKMWVRGGEQDEARRLAKLASKPDE
jgi:hypothetical protein